MLSNLHQQAQSEVSTKTHNGLQYQSTSHKYTSQIT